MKRLLGLALATVVAGTVALFAPAPQASAAACASPWAAGTVYTGGNQASHNGRNYTAQWWTQGETPGGASVWQDNGSCDGGSGNPGTPVNCNHPNWVAGQWYPAGSIVKYTNGQFYRAKNENPGYDPVISTWYWEPFNCNGGDPGNPGSFPVSEGQFNQMFPSRNPFYTYQGLINALSAYPAFAGSGSDVTKKQEAAAFLANVNHETGGLRYVVEQNTANYPHYCDRNQPYGCPAGQAAYYGRGPIQLSWNFNYKAAGDALGIDLLNNPYLVQNDPAVAWKTGIWYWMTQNGPGSMTAHNAIVGGHGFGQTIRSINGSLECDGKNPAQVQSRVTAYQNFAGILGVTPGGNLYC